MTRLKIRIFLLWQIKPVLCLKDMISFSLHPVTDFLISWCAHGVRRDLMLIHHTNGINKVTDGIKRT